MSSKKNTVCKKPKKINTKKKAIEYSFDLESSSESETNDISKILKKNSASEWCPSLNDELWKKNSGDVYKYDGVIQKMEYIVTNELINKIKEHKNIDTFKQTDDLDYDIYRMYKLCDKDEKYNFIGFSKNTLLNILSIELFYYYWLDERPNKFNAFEKNNVKITDTKIVLLGIYKAKKSTNVRTEMNKIKKTFENNVPINSDAKKVIFMEYLGELLEDEKFNKKKYYIQKIYSKNNKDDAYIVGGFEKLKIDNINDYVDDNCIEFDDNKLKIDIIEEQIVRCETEGLLIVDMFLENSEYKNNKSILIGNNNDVKKRIFMMIQREIMRNDLFDLKFGDNWYVAYIGDDEKKYIFCGKGYVKNKISEFYSMVYHNCKKYDRLINFISATKWKDIVFKCIRKNITDDEIDFVKSKIMNTFNKDGLMNYYDEEYATKKELKSTKAFFFMKKK